MSGFDFELSGIVQGAGELKQVVCETDVQVGWEAEMEQKSCPKVQIKLRRERGNYEKFACHIADQVG